MYDEIYVMETVNILKEKELEKLYHYRSMQNNQKKELLCKLPVIKNLQVCQC
ncbi:hypothetical protein NCCP133_28480 [Cytobacillus sp. NCCP-133]|nr:hypothetical protein NCCP133_28480 [Cytobacillus sp. NCCP-133]